jgi:hypothetical protein
METIEQLKKKLESNFVKGHPDYCWLWKGSIQPGKNKGYGRINVNNINSYSHRVSYLVYKGDPGNLHVCHKCDNPACVNPNHLFVASHQDNMKDRNAKGRQYHILTIVEKSIIKEAILKGFSCASIGRYFKRHPNTIIQIKNSML